MKNTAILSGFMIIEFIIDIYLALQLCTKTLCTKTLERNNVL